jgi:hypothetical protein
VVCLQEQSLLRKLRFNLEVHTPHIFLLHYAKMFGFSNPVIRVAYALLSDSLCSDACISHPAHVLAAASLSAGARLLGVNGAAASNVACLPANRKWFSLCDVTERQMVDACAVLLAPYADIV